MSAITRNRELSQFGSFLYIDDTTQSITITEANSPNVGIGSTIPRTKLDVLGNVNVTGIISATTFSGIFSGNATNSTTANYALVSGISSVAAGIGTTSNLKTSGIITASAFYINDTLIINPEFATWLPATGISGSVYRLGNVGIGTSVGVTEKLVVNGNVSANRLVSTIPSGTAPFQVSSSTLVTNLNADFLRGRPGPQSDIVGINDVQTLTNKTLTSPLVGGGINLAGSSSGFTNLRASATASGTLTLPPETGTLVSTGSVSAITSTMIANNTITNSNISSSAAIEVSKLSASTISGITLGGNLNSLSFGSHFISDGSYNGSAARTVSIAATTANTANSLVARNASGDFNAGTITASYLNSTFTVTAGNIVDNGDLTVSGEIYVKERSLTSIITASSIVFGL